MKNILQMLENTAARLPQHLSFCDETNENTWGQTLAQVRSIGTALAAAGVCGQPVALYLDHTATCLTAMLGVLAGGGFYTVLDTAQPAERVRSITAQLQPALILTDAAHEQAARALEAGPVLCMEQALATAPDEAALAAVRSGMVDTDLAYILFTSGSTGAPKGVAISHRNVLAYSAWAAETFAITQDTVFGNQTPFYFSMSVTDLYTSVRTGACLQVVPKRLFSFPVQLLEYLCAKAVNTIYWVPSAMAIVTNWKALDYTAPPALHTILFAGEVMPTAKLNYWRTHYPKALFANLYGPTETTDICAYYVLNRDFAEDEALPIGNHCDNCALLVLCQTETGWRQAAPGEEGELCARGSFLAAGYYAMPDKTAERFIQNPLQPNYPEVVYRTGDLVRLDERGEYQYCGRIDHQIKHMGYRIEPGEIETAASGQEKLEACVCLYDAPKDRLVLFYQAKRDVTEALRVRLAEKLPAYMRPAAYCRMPLLPQNANGKLDRGVLKQKLAEV